MAAASNLGQCALRISPLLLVPVALIAGVPWLIRISYPMAILVTAAAVVFAMSYANYLQFRATRRLDEVQKAGAAFAQQWGAPAGQAAFALLLVLPPFAGFATATVSAFVSRFAGHPLTVDRTAVVLSMGLGFVVLVFLEAVGRVVVHAMWWTDKR
jgi:glucan phosphoethanolaminetransferase (alkaline phosphatase superfamily)